MTHIIGVSGKPRYDAGTLSLIVFPDRRCFAEGPGRTRTMVDRTEHGSPEGDAVRADVDSKITTGGQGINEDFQGCNRRMQRPRDERSCGVGRSREERLREVP